MFLGITRLPRSTLALAQRLFTHDASVLAHQSPGGPTRRDHNQRDDWQRLTVIDKCPEWKPVQPMKSYGHSRLADALFAFELQKSLRKCSCPVS